MQKHDSKTFSLFSLSPSRREGGGRAPLSPRRGGLLYKKHGQKKEM